MVAFVAVLQFLPGLIGAFYWRQANKTGLVAGLLAGFFVWFATLFFPLVSDLVYSSLLTSSPLLYEQRLYEPQGHTWHFAATCFAHRRTPAPSSPARLLTKTHPG
ncbi:MAG: hypothetical protein U5O39_02745 [Gammaproteobacteria bacterium]|nr:hypothetical protein [Gammaproteobacteria bacterium]